MNLPQTPPTQLFESNLQAQAPTAEQGQRVDEIITRMQSRGLGSYLGSAAKSTLPGLALVAAALGVYWFFIRGADDEVDSDDSIYEQEPAEQEGDGWAPTSLY